MDYRRYITRYNIMASESSQDREHDPDVSVTDVYDHAAGIASEFDRLINSYGNEAVTKLMPKVIRVLVQLEALASRYEKDNEETAHLRSSVEKLEAEKAGRAQQRAKFEQELEVIEENWKSEVKDLLEVVDKLQAENKRLKLSLQNEKYAMEDQVSARYRETEEQEIKVLTRLKETVDKQREELRSLNRDLSQKAVDCEALEAQLEQIAKVNGDLRHKNNTHKKQVRNLLEEKAELEVALHQKDADVEKVKVMIAEREKFEEQRAAVRAAIVEQRTSEEDGEEIAADGLPGTKSVAAETAAGESDADSTNTPASPGLDLEGKLIIDLKDPNRPRFTLHELRQVLMERNELKTRLIEVEEELSLYRPRNLNYSGEELPVYGPINKEPDEKLFGPRESGIRKFFQRMTAAMANKGLTPRRQIQFFISGWEGLTFMQSEWESEGLHSHQQPVAVAASSSSSTPTLLCTSGLVDDDDSSGYYYYGCWSGVSRSVYSNCSMTILLDDSFFATGFLSPAALWESNHF